MSQQKLVLYHQVYINESCVLYTYTNSDQANFDATSVQHSTVKDLLLFNRNKIFLGKQQYTPTPWLTRILVLGKS